MKKLKKEVDNSFTEFLQPTQLLAAKDEWNKMRKNKKVMRENRNRKRA